MKKILLSLTLLTTLFSLTACSKNNSSSTSSSTSSSEASSSQTEEKKLYNYREKGTKTSTSIVVTFIVNLPSDKDGVFCRYYLEKGEKMNKFGLAISGYYYSYWYYDRYGTNMFDFDQEVNDNMTLYAYTSFRDSRPEIDSIEESGQFNLNWINGKYSSFELVSSSSLKTKANLNDEIEFKLKYYYYVDQEAIVKVNNQEIKHDENGIYKFIVTGDTTISASDVNLDLPEEKPMYTLFINDTEYKMSLQEGAYGGSEYVCKGIELNKGDTFYIQSLSGTKYYSCENEGYETSFTAPRDGIYDFYFKLDSLKTWVTIPDPVYSYKLNGNSSNISDTTFNLDLNENDNLKFYMDGEVLIYEYNVNETGTYKITIIGSTVTITKKNVNDLTYTVNNLPNWASNDGCLMFIWAWNEAQTGMWIKAEFIDSTTLTFDYDGSLGDLTGMLVARCTKVTTEPDWSITSGDGAGRIYNKSANITIKKGTTIYTVSSLGGYPEN